MFFLQVGLDNDNNPNCQQANTMIGMMYQKTKCQPHQHFLQDFWTNDRYRHMSPMSFYQAPLKVTRNNPPAGFILQSETNQKFVTVSSTRLVTHDDTVSLFRNSDFVTIVYTFWLVTLCKPHFDI
jgi:hypothetical protein